MNNYAWEWQVLVDYRWAFINGTVVTILLTAVVIVAGSILGLIGGVLTTKRCNNSKWLRTGVIAIVEIIRSLPVLVLLIWMHYVTPISSSWLHDAITMFCKWIPGNIEESAIGKGVSSRAFATAAVALSINLAAFVSDIVRSGINNVPNNLVDAAKSLGMTRSMQLRRVLLPSAMRNSVAGMLAMYITMFKFTTLAAFIGCPELMNVVFTAGNNSYRYLELYTVMAFLYLLILLPLTFLARRLEQSKWLKVLT